MSSFVRRARAIAREKKRPARELCPEYNTRVAGSLRQPIAQGLLDWQPLRNTAIVYFDSMPCSFLLSFYFFVLGAGFYFCLVASGEAPSFSV